MGKERFYIHKGSGTKIAIPDSLKDIRSTNSIKYDGNSLVEDSQGYFYLYGTILTSGLMNYSADELFDPIPDGMKADDNIEVWTKEEELYNCAESFNLKPLTLDHPNAPVGSELWLDVAVGVVGSCRVIENSIDSDIRVFGAEAKETILNNDLPTELSTGFYSDIKVMKDGRLYHTNIRGDHVAIVERGRCGANCSIKFSFNSKKGKKIMILDLKNGSKVEVPDETAGNNIQVAIDGLHSKNETLKGEISGLNLSIENLKKNHISADKIEKMAKERADLILLVGEDFDEKMTNMEIKKKIITNAGGTIPENPSDDFINGVLHTIKSSASGTSGGSHFMNKVNNNVSDEDRASEAFEGLS